MKSAINSALLQQIQSMQNQGQTDSRILLSIMKVSQMHPQQSTADLSDNECALWEALKTSEQSDYLC